MKKFIVIFLSIILVISSMAWLQENKPASMELSGSEYPADANYSIQPIPFTEVTMTDDFWEPKMKINAEVTIPFVIQKSSGGRYFINNAIQAAIYSLQNYPDPELQEQVDAYIQQMVTVLEEKKSFTNSFFEVAVAYYEATGNRDLLDLAVKSAEKIYNLYKEKSPPFSGGERDAINFIELYRVTQEKKHLDMAKYYIDIRGLENSEGKSRHSQSHKPVLEQSEAVGHAVNCASLMVSLADVGTLTGIYDYFQAARRMWEDAVGSKFYITGGIGSTGNEGFGQPYSLPNISAYCETCAGIMFATFNHRMFLATGDSKYIDIMERSIYNNVIDGVSASGDRFFYVNRLASVGDGRDLRWEWASLPCCPPNLVRFLASMPGYMYAQKGEEMYINLYASSETSFRVNEKVLHLSIESEMPWEGKSTITIYVPEEVKGTIKLRIPGWARNKPLPGELYSYLNHIKELTEISVNGSRIPGTVDESGYVSLNRIWEDGDRIEIEFPFTIRKVKAHPKVRADRGKMAVERGPLVYCVEWPDTEDGQVLELLFDAEKELISSFDEEFFGGAAILSGRARNISIPESTYKSVKLIPYHLWANRGAGEMSVWLSKREYKIGDMGPAGGLVFYVNPNYKTDGWRYLEAAPFDQSEGAPWGCFRMEIPGAKGTAIGTGLQNTLDMESGCTIPGTAADLCSNFTFNGFSDWFLPSVDELMQLYLNLKVMGIHDFGDSGIPDNFTFWSSTQRSADMAFHLDFADNGSRRHYDDKDFPRRVRAVRVF